MVRALGLSAIVGGHLGELRDTPAEILSGLPVTGTHMARAEVMGRQTHAIAVTSLFFSSECDARRGNLGFV